MPYADRPDPVRQRVGRRSSTGRKTRRALTGRPLVLLAPDRTRILPYRAGDDGDPIRPSWPCLPGLTDAFLGGVWLVHNGVAADKAGLAAYHVHDAEDPRRRAFFCLLPDGRPALGATTYVTPSAALGPGAGSPGCP